MLVIFDKKTRKDGVKSYLENGTNNDRESKDKRISLLGDLDILQKTIDIANQKNYKESYRNIVLSFEEDDITSDKISEVVQDFIKNYMIAYTEDEYTAYGEAHIPKQKFKLIFENASEKYKYKQAKKDKNFDLESYIKDLEKRDVKYKKVKRKAHAHISIATYSNKLQRRLDLGNHKYRLKEITLLKEHLEAKYNLKSVTKNAITKSKDEVFNNKKFDKQVTAKQTIKQHVEQNISKYEKFDDMIADITKTFNIQDIKHSTAKAKTKYISIKLANFNKNIRLNGELFNKETFDNAKKQLQNTNKNTYVVANNNTDTTISKSAKLQELQAKRIEYANKKYKKAREYAAKREEIVNSAKLRIVSAKLLYRTKKTYTRKFNTSFKYSSSLDSFLLNMLKNTTQETISTFKSSFKAIVSNFIQRQQAKRRNKEYITKQKELIERLEKPSNNNSDFQSHGRKLSNSIDSKLEKVTDEIKKDEIDFKTLKATIKAQVLLNYLDNKKLLKSDYEVTNDNKIKVANRNYNVVDFCLKEMNFSFKETNTLLQEVYKIDLKDFKKVEKINKKIIKKEIKNDRKRLKKQQRRDTRKYIRNTPIKNDRSSKFRHRNDLSLLSEVDLVNSKTRDKMLLSSDKQSIIHDDRNRRANFTLRYADTSDRRNDRSRRAKRMIDYNKIKQEINPLVLNEILSDNIQAYQISKNDKNEFRVKVANRNYNITNYLTQIKKIKFSEIEKLVDDMYKINDKFKNFEVKEKSNNELNKIKEYELKNLAFVAQYFNYKIDRKRSTDTYLTMTNNDDTIIIKKNENDKYVYFRHSNKKNKKLYDLFAEHNIKKYSEIIDILENKVDFNTDIKELLKSNDKAVEQEIEALKELKEFNNNVNIDYLTQERKIDESIVEAYKHNFKTDNYNNLILATQNYDESKNAFITTSYEKRITNRDISIKAINKGQKAVAILTPNESIIDKDINIIVCENYIDAMSLLELENKQTSDNTIIISLGGQISAKQLHTLKKYLEINKNNLFKIKSLKLAFDNDDAGLRFTEQVKKIAQELDIKTEVKKAKLKDFNEDLKAKKMKNKTNEMSNKDILIAKIDNACNYVKTLKKDEIDTKTREALERINASYKAIYNDNDITNDDRKKIAYICKELENVIEINENSINR